MMAYAAPFKPLTKDDIAEILGVSTRTIEIWVGQRTIPAPTPIGSRVFWHPDVFYSWLDQHLRRAENPEVVVDSAVDRAEPTTVKLSAKDRLRSQRDKRQSMLNATTLESVAASQSFTPLQ